MKNTAEAVVGKTGKGEDLLCTHMTVHPPVCLYRYTDTIYMPMAFDSFDGKNYSFKTSFRS